MDTATAVKPPVADEFTAHDRCDRCGAQAQARFILSAGELMFCGHHARKYEVPLENAVQAAG